MKPLMIIAALAVMLGSCGKRESVTAGETRPPTMRDENLKLDATSAERFGTGAQAAPGMGREATPPAKSPLIPTTIPEGWEEAETSAFRLLNYKFGELGEVYVSLSGGGVLENANRWLAQFGGEPVDAAALAGLEEVSLPGYEGKWITADGTYSSGMGRPPMTKYALNGVVTSGPDGIFTVKMIGPADQVEAQKEKLREFVASLKPAK